METAINLGKILSVAPIRDAIMCELAPMEVMNLVLWLRIRMSQTDLNVYTSVLKLFVADRKWLVKMLNNGYDITVLGNKLPELMSKMTHLNDNGIEIIDPETDPITKVVLVVTRNGHFVSPGEVIVPTQVLRTNRPNIPEHRTWPVAMTPWMRVVDVCNYGSIIRIMMPLMNQETTVPISLSGFTHMNLFIDKNAPVSSVKHVHAKIGRDKIASAPVLYYQKTPTIVPSPFDLFVIRSIQKMDDTIWTVLCPIKRLYRSAPSHIVAGPVLFLGFTTGRREDSAIRF